MLTNLAADARHGLREILRRPAFALVVVLTLAFGVGVNTAIFSLFQQVLLRPLPVSEPERLVNLSASGPTGAMRRSCGPEGPCSSVFSYPMFRDLAREQTPFVDIAGHRLGDMTLRLDGAATDSSGLLVSGEYFRTLGIQPALGRLLGPDDDREGAAQAVVLTYSYWRARLGADPSVLGRRLLVNGQPLTIVGVAPQGFHGTTPGRRPSVFVPITFRESTHDYASLAGLDDRRFNWVYLFARLAPGVSMEQAEAAIDPLYLRTLSDVEAPAQTRLGAQDLAESGTKGLVLEPGARGQSRLPDGARPTLNVLVAVAAVVLVLCCANIANLMLARGSDRVAEIAVRASMGASAHRLATLLLTEALLLALVAAAMSWPLTLAALEGLSAWLPGLRTAAFEVHLDTEALGFAFAVAALSALVFSLGPILKLMRMEPGSVLQVHGVRQTGGKAAARFRAGLATSQVALSMALLVVAVLFARSLLNIGRVDLGVEIDSLATFSIAPSRSGYTPERERPLYDRLEQELRAIPGVTSVSSSAIPLLGGDGWGMGVRVEGFEPGSAPNRPPLFNPVGAGYFATVGMPLVAGRAFTDADTENRPKVAVVNERFVEHFGLGRAPLGKRLALGADGPLEIEIVGVVRDAKYRGAKETIEPQLFLPRHQFQDSGRMSYYVRSALPSEQLLGAIAKVVAAVDPRLPTISLRTMEEQVASGVAEDRSITALASAFAVLATVLAAVGLYGVLSYTVVQRTHELGVRLALGAPPAELRALVLRQVARMAAIGSVLGLGAALLLGRGLRALLFGVEPAAPGMIVVAAVVLTAVVLAAAYWPARRASHIDPTVALRCD